MQVAKRWRSVAALLAVIPLPYGAAMASGPTFPEELEALRVQHEVPALAAAAFLDGKIVDATAVGFRKAGNETRVTVEDRWHIGSCTKSMTATLAAMLVEEGRIRWDSTVGEVLPELREKMAGPWAEVTLEQLLTHRAGAPANPPGPLWAMAWQRAGTPREQRLAFAQGLLQLPQEVAAGTKFIYSNQGYSIAGTMLERTMNRPWEELLQERLFAPLGMKSAGFGAPGQPGMLDQPWGHMKKLEPVEPGPAADNPPAIGPGGTVHCSISDLARYAGRHAQESRGPADLLQEAGAWQKLHTPAEGQTYAMGWHVLERPWAEGRALTHNGTNTMWYAVMWVAPERNAAFVAATNVESKGASQACDAAVSALIQRHLRDSAQ